LIPQMCLPENTILRVYLLFHGANEWNMFCNCSTVFQILVTIVTSECVWVSKRTRYWDRKGTSYGLTNVNFLRRYLILGNSLLMPGLSAEQRDTNLAWFTL
jgi:hypothetical protein